MKQVRFIQATSGMKYGYPTNVFSLCGAYDYVDFSISNYDILYGG